VFGFVTLESSAGTCLPFPIGSEKSEHEPRSGIGEHVGLSVLVMFRFLVEKKKEREKEKEVPGHKLSK
jgi:hypothetical protein